MRLTDRARWAVVIAACIIFAPVLFAAAAVAGALDHTRDAAAHRRAGR